MGQGDILLNLEFVFFDLKDEFLMLMNKFFVVVVLGDSGYGESFCGVGYQIFDLLKEFQGKFVVDLLKVDVMEIFELEKDVVEWVNSIKVMFVGE